MTGRRWSLSRPHIGPICGAMLRDRMRPMRTVAWPFWRLTCFTRLSTVYSQSITAFWPVDLPSYSATIGRRLSKCSERQGGCHGDKN